MPSGIDTTFWSPILESGRNCWRMATADRLAVIVDTAAYFKAFAEACEQAEHQILIIGWDFDRHEDLFHDDQERELPTQLGAFLRALVKRKKSLRVFLLSWDLNMIYAPDREWLPALRLRLRTPPRFHFRLDGQHPTGGSQHQKIVVIDHKVAFCGGIDLTRWRWDTPDHLADDPRRVDPNGEPYSPFHDTMMVVEGPAAAALGELARYRWRRSRGWKIRKAKKSEGNPWPASIKPMLCNQPVAISRTFPAFKRHGRIREIRRLSLDAIAAAKRFIYIENQYFTSLELGDAICQRLAEKDGPEVLLVLPEKTGGWLEQLSMDVLRGRLLTDMEAADAYDRLDVMYPHQPGLGNDCIHVHSKLLIVDDCLLKVGSANTSNRSMGLDSECDLTIEAEVSGDETSAQIKSLRQQLLAEHLGCETDAFANAEVEHSSMRLAVRALHRTDGRSLRPLDLRIAEEIDELVPDAKLVDPAEPYSTDYFRKEYIPKLGRSGGQMRLMALASIVMLMLTLAAAWHFTPLQHHVSLHWLGEYFESLPDESSRAAVTIASVATLSLLMVPLTLLAMVAGLVLGSWHSFIYVFAGAMLSAVISYLVGQFTGFGLLNRISGSRLDKLSIGMGSHGVIGVVVMRLVPIAPFTVFNLVAGASRLKLRSFVLGSLLGLTPMLGAVTWFAGSLWETVKAPSPSNMVVTVSSALLLMLFIGWIRKWLR